MAQHGVYVMPPVNVTNTRRVERRSGGHWIAACLGPDDIDAINGVVSRAIQTWDLPDRVKRLALPSYLYTSADCEHMAVRGARHDRKLIGVLALEPVSSAQHAAAHTLAIHGLYVEPSWHRAGVGTLLLQTAVTHAEEHGCRRLVAKAIRHSRGFFIRQGFDEAPAGAAGSGYPHTFLLTL
jgi:GNAT superfamily N-acetyltransferase